MRFGYFDDEAREYVVTRPAKRKTPGGMPRYCSDWLKRSDRQRREGAG